ncbi:hypothetical protein P3X46_021269 [Hevea brasiliensis]|uniref:Reverse transcriptase zinc-binding domain-containing protein n=1 Tax=Hevea brasiliensis TaxID=3981 RepID=A0ABQ9LF03_HEVBR|nr:hypothetical protein P3X46_021269 [Hevea brasiliensis]
MGFRVYRGLFVDSDVQRILALVPPSENKDDCLIWHFSIKGTYNVKSAFHVAASMYLNLENFGIQGLWKKVWCSILPTKIKNFVWRVLRDILPAKTNLQGRGITLNLSCHFYGEREDTPHIFLSCPFAVACCNLFAIYFLVSDINALFSHIFSLNNDDPVMKVCSLLWSIWWHRNLSLWERKQVVPFNVFRHVNNF